MLEQRTRTWRTTCSRLDAISCALPPAVLAAGASFDAASAGVLEAREAPRERRGPANYEAWTEVDEAALRHNAREVARIAGGRPVLAVVKNNAYGLGVARIGAVLDTVADVAVLMHLNADLPKVDMTAS